MSDNPWNMLYEAWIAMEQEQPLAFPYRDYPAPDVTRTMIEAALAAGMNKVYSGPTTFYTEMYRVMRLYRPLSEGPEP